MKVIVIDETIYYLTEEMYDKVRSEYSEDCSKNDPYDFYYDKKCGVKLIYNIRIKSEMSVNIDHLMKT